jgi:transcriptional regulator with XRE-family HTH domain
VEDEWLVEAFGARLRQIRNRAGLSQEQLSRAARISRTSIVNIEKARQGVSLTTLYRLADALGVDRNELLPDRPNQPSVTIAIGDRSDAARSSLASVLQRIEEGHGSHAPTQRRSKKS